MAISRPSEFAPVNRRGGRGRGRGSAGPRASLTDEEGKIIPQLAHYAGGKGQKDQPESAEPKLFPDIPAERYPPRPHTVGRDPDSVEEHLRSHIYPKPNTKQIFMRNAMARQLGFYRSSNYYITDDDVLNNGGVAFEKKSASWIKPGMHPEYYPEELTMKDGTKKRRKQTSEALHEKAIAAAAAARKRHHQQQGQPVIQDAQALLDKLAEKEANSARQAIDLDEEIEEPEDYDGDDLDEQWDGDNQYANFDDDEGYEDDDLDGNENVY